jgi:radical SAM superfamily enzyme YgiQ (UPF0313 family)
MKSDDRKIGPEEILSRLDDILPHVEKPGRYFAGELGAVRKNWEAALARMAIAFPDVYEIAAANLGHRLIRHIINSRDGFLAERVFAPWPDMEAKLRETGTPLYSLESFRPIADFDILGVSLTHELSFTNLLLLIDLAGLPLRAADRGFPIVIAGGPAVFNPEPVSPFVDAFLLGDGEDAALEMIEIVAAFREKIDTARGDLDTEKRIKAEITDRWGGSTELAEVGAQERGLPSPHLQGVYVPSHFDVSQDPDGRIIGISNTVGGPDLVRKALVADLESAPWELEPLIPHLQGITNRVTIEPIRGCTHGCRFCQAGMIYRPYRERSTDLVISQAEKLLDSTGLQEQSFLALSATDWPHLQDFIRKMQQERRDFHLRISLPSGRIAALDRDLTDLLASSRKGGLTLAIEAATPRLRAVINKDVTDEDIKSAVESAVRSGWDLIKLYFMIGLPSETDDDVLAIVDLIRHIRSVHQSLKREGETNVGRLRLKVSVSSFVPKAHTPFQWAPMDSPVTLDRKQKMLLELRRMKGVDYSSHDIGASRIEGILARGDRRIADAIERAFALGARFDAWSDKCDPQLWDQAFRDVGLDPDWYLRGRDIDEILPWDHLSCGVEKDWLKEDWLRALSEATIPDCNEAGCLQCGLHSIYPDCRPLRLHPSGSESCLS